MSKAKLQKRIALIVIAVLSLTVLVSAAILKGRSTDDSQPAEVELITLRPAGFEPAEITRPKGAFVLFLDDRSGRETSSLILRRLSGEHPRTINLERKKSNWNEVVDLPPGTYILQDKSNAEARCQITILP